MQLPAVAKRASAHFVECLISHWLTRRSVRTYVRCTVGRTHDVTTKPKFLPLMGLPKSLSYGAPRAELRYEGDTESQTNNIVIIMLLLLLLLRKSSP